MFAAIVLIVAVVAVPWGWYARSKAAKANETKPAVVPEQPTLESQAAPVESPAAQTEAETAAPALNSEAADQAKRQREARLREEARAREKAGDTTASLPLSQQSPAAAKPQTSHLERSQRGDRTSDL
mgnify:CR=1 FL=1